METRGQQKLLLMQTRGCVSTRLQSTLQGERCPMNRSQSSTNTKAARGLKQSPRGSVTEKTRILGENSVKVKPKQPELILRRNSHQPNGSSPVSVKPVHRPQREALRQTNSASKTSQRQRRPIATVDKRLNRSLPGRESLRCRSPPTNVAFSETAFHSGLMVTRRNSLAKAFLSHSTDNVSTLSIGTKPVDCHTETNSSPSNSIGRTCVRQKNYSIKSKVNKTVLVNPKKALLTVDRNTLVETESPIAESCSTGETDQSKGAVSGISHQEECSSNEWTVTVTPSIGKLIPNGVIVNQGLSLVLDSELSSLASECRDDVSLVSEESDKSFQIQSIDLPASLTPVVCLHKLGKQSIEELSGSKSDPKPDTTTSEVMSLNGNVLIDQSQQADWSKMGDKLPSECAKDSTELKFEKTGDGDKLPSDDTKDGTKENSESKKFDPSSQFSVMSLASLIAKVSDRLKGSETKLIVEENEEIVAGDDDEEADEILGEEQVEGAGSGNDDGECSVHSNVSYGINELDDECRESTLSSNDMTLAGVEKTSFVDNNLLEVRLCSASLTDRAGQIDNVLGADDELAKVRKVGRSHLREYKKILTASLQQGGSEEVINLDDDEDDGDSLISKLQYVSKSNDTVRADRDQSITVVNCGKVAICESSEVNFQVSQNIVATDKNTEAHCVIDKMCRVRGDLSTEGQHNERIDSDEKSREEMLDEASDIAPEDKVRQLLRRRKDLVSKSVVTKSPFLTEEDGINVVKNFDKENPSAERKSVFKSDELDELNVLKATAETLITKPKEYEVIEIDGTMFRAFDSEESLEEYVICLEHERRNENFSCPTKHMFAGNLSSPKKKQFRYGIAGNVRKYLRKRDEIKSGMKRVGQYLQRNDNMCGSLPKPHFSRMDDQSVQAVQSQFKSPSKTADVTKIKGWQAKYTPQRVMGSDNGLLSTKPEPVKGIDLIHQELPPVVNDAKTLNTSEDALLRILLTQNVQDLGLHLRTQRGGIRSRHQINFQRERFGEDIDKPSMQVLKKKNVASIEEDENQPSKGWIYGRRIDGKFATKAAVNKIKKRGRNPIRRLTSGQIWNRKLGRYYTRPKLTLRYVIISKKMALNAIRALSTKFVKPDLGRDHCGDDEKKSKMQRKFSWYMSFMLLFCEIV